MGFFANFHRSVVDRQFYAGFVRGTPLRGGRHALAAVLLSVLITTVWHTGRAWDPRDGVVPAFTELLQSLSVENGNLLPGSAEPYPLPSASVARAWKLFSVAPDPGMGAFDSVVMVDTGRIVSTAPSNRFRVFLRKRCVEIMPGRGKPQTIEYAAFFPSGRVTFSAANLRAALPALTPVLAIFYFARDLVSIGFTAFFAIALFSTATYIFKKPRVLRLRIHARVACFAVGPLVAGATVMALADSRQTLAWYFFFGVSLFLHARGIDTAARSVSPG